MIAELLDRVIGSDKIREHCEGDNKQKEPQADYRAAVLAEITPEFGEPPGGGAGCGFQGGVGHVTCRMRGLIRP